MTVKGFKKLKKCSCGLDPYYRKSIMKHSNGNEETMRILCDCGKQSTRYIIQEGDLEADIREGAYQRWETDDLDVDFDGTGVIGGFRTKDGKKKVK